MLRTVMHATPDDLVAVVYLSANRIAPAHEGLELGIGDASIIKALAEACGRKEEQIKSQYKETKIQAMSDNIARSIGSGRFLEWKAVNAEGASGRILICWDKRSLEVLDWEEGQFTLSCRFRNVENGARWVFTGVYGLFSKMEREALWDELGAIRGLWEDPWCIGGTLT
ncbi:DNA ligase 1 [Vitis vinifera]|uniref:DNA ligase 1 n=1 Tax=Vitis vinifera TaxID=29760 RepID=A0A438F2M5_VITVI|nr:DNA ligase 1 [Vitis vinifera]